MYIVHILGGLGNQMFQFAFAYAISKEAGSSFKLDISDLEAPDQRNYALDHYCINVELASLAERQKYKYENESTAITIIRKLTRRPRGFARTFHKEAHFHFDNSVSEITGDAYLQGYWQSEKYFHVHRDDLLAIFSPKNKLHPDTIAYRQKIMAAQSIGLHVRRGDYASDAKTRRMHGSCTLEYYEEAVLLFKKKLPAPHYFIFSDDLPWARDNLDFIEHKSFVKLENQSFAHEEMHLMSICQHNIIANSSFSWWGAWLNANPDKTVIAPKRWFADETINTKDLIPENWLCL